MRSDKQPETSARRWPVQDAKARFSELLEASLKEGPQIVTRRGIEAAVLVPVEEWRRLQDSARPTLKELLLADSPRARIAIPSRSQWRRRRPKALG
jgi:prevent-host-death family protein